MHAEALADGSSSSTCSSSVLRDYMVSIGLMPAASSGAHARGKRGAGKGKSRGKPAAKPTREHCRDPSQSPPSPSADDATRDATPPTAACAALGPAFLSGLPFPAPVTGGAVPEEGLQLSMNVGMGMTLGSAAPLEWPMGQSQLATLSLQLHQALQLPAALLPPADGTLPMWLPSLEHMHAFMRMGIDPGVMPGDPHGAVIPQHSNSHNAQLDSTEHTDTSQCASHGGHYAQSSNSSQVFTPGSSVVVTDSSETDEGYQNEGAWRFLWPAKRAKRSYMWRKRAPTERIAAVLPSAAELHEKIREDVDTQEEFGSMPLPVEMHSALGNGAVYGSHAVRRHSGMGSDAGTAGSSTGMAAVPSAAPPLSAMIPAASGYTTSAAAAAAGLPPRPPSLPAGLSLFQAAVKGTGTNGTGDDSADASKGAAAAAGGSGTAAADDTVDMQAVLAGRRPRVHVITIPRNRMVAASSNKMRTGVCLSPTTHTHDTLPEQQLTHGSQHKRAAGGAAAAARLYMQPGLTGSFGPALTHGPVCGVLHEEDVEAAEVMLALGRYLRGIDSNPLLTG